MKQRYNVYKAFNKHGECVRQGADFGGTIFIFGGKADLRPRRCETTNHQMANYRTSVPGRTVKAFKRNAMKEVGACRFQRVIVIGEVQFKGLQPTEFNLLGI